MDALLTPYGEEIDPSCPLPEYPRPQLVRNSYQNLNGHWHYAITAEGKRPDQWDGKILVPFPPESLLSGVSRSVKPSDFLWYKRLFSLEEPWDESKRVLLHFGAVDQCCVVYVNGSQAGGHDGGYVPFTLDITAYVSGAEEELVVMVIDETDEAPYGRGRQKYHHGGLWHTPQSGIWQTVWIETVPKEYITSVHITPLYDEGAVEFLLAGNEKIMEGTIEIFARSALVADAAFQTGKIVKIPLQEVRGWHPSDPFLYTVRIRAGKDVMVSYFGLRKISVKKDASGHMRVLLNNDPLILRGIMDQGMYSDSLYTPPSDDAMVDDIQFAKECGFNMIYKQGKIEPLRWYYHCDRQGMLVWQDFPSGGDIIRENGRENGPEPHLWQKWFSNRIVKDSAYRRMGRSSAEGRRVFRRDMRAVMKTLYNAPSLITWVLFYRGWGQFDAAKLTAVLKKQDPTRLVDHASGRYDQRAGNFLSLHVGTELPSALPKEEKRVIAFTAVGGYGLVPPGHFLGKKPWAASMVSSKKELAEAIGNIWQNHLLDLIPKGLSVFIYVQLTDAEDEVSGLVTGNRRIKKVDPQQLARYNNENAFHIKKK